MFVFVTFMFFLLSFRYLPDWSELQYESFFFKCGGSWWQFLTPGGSNRPS
jgi:hypothetical protein